MARRKLTNTITFPGIRAKGSRPAGSTKRLPGGAKVSGPYLTGGTNTFTGPIAAMRGIVGGRGKVNTNSRPVTNKSGAKGVDRSLRG